MTAWRWLSLVLLRCHFLILLDDGLQHIVQLHRSLTLHCLDGGTPFFSLLLRDGTVNTRDYSPAHIHLFLCRIFVFRYPVTSSLLLLMMKLIETDNVIDTALIHLLFTEARDHGLLHLLVAGLISLVSHRTFGKSLCIFLKDLTRRDRIVAHLIKDMCQLLVLLKRLVSAAVVQTADAHSPRNHLTQDKNAQAATIEEFYDFEDVAETPAQTVAAEIVQREENILRLHWDIVPNAVKYEIFIGGASLFSYTNGIEIPVNDVHAKFQVNALSLEGNTLQNRIPIRDIDTNPSSPRTTTEFDKMAYPPIYPVYSWIPTNGADHYEIELIKDGKIIRRYFTQPRQQDDDFDLYDKVPVLDEGEYFWRVRALNQDNQPLTEWSAKDESNSFEVKHRIRFCALGDSITHGGGSISAPPSTVVYNWETYCAIPVKNLGRSGDTTAEMLDRFDNDVLPFAPRVMVIMAGVNDIRTGKGADEVINNLKALRDKCLANDITPVFCTITSMNPEIINLRGIPLTDSDWREQREQVNFWIMNTPYFVDVAKDLTDEFGYLRAELTPDGLHPALRGKKIIGEKIADYLKKNF